jgi:hypothetical protein
MHLWSAVDGFSFNVIFIDYDGREYSYGTV